MKTILPHKLRRLVTMMAACLFIITTAISTLTTSPSASFAQSNQLNKIDKIAKPTDTVLLTDTQVIIRNVRVNLTPDVNNDSLVTTKGDLPLYYDALDIIAHGNQPTCTSQVKIIISGNSVVCTSVWLPLLLAGQGASQNSLQIPNLTLNDLQVQGITLSLYQRHLQATATSLPTILPSPPDTQLPLKKLLKATINVNGVQLKYCDHLLYVNINDFNTLPGKNYHNLHGERMIDKVDPSTPTLQNTKELRWFLIQNNISKTLTKTPTF